MSYNYWQKQQIDKPLFEDLIWSKPQQKSLSGNLLIIGGNSHAIGAPSIAFAEALKQGVGECKVVLPDKTRKLLGPKLPLEIELIKSTLSGSFASTNEDELKSYLAWANATLFAGDLGHNSETTVLLEKLSKCGGLQIYTQESADYFSNTPKVLFERPDTVLVLTFAQLQKFVQKAGFHKALTSDMNLLQLVEVLHDLTNKFPCIVVTEHQTLFITACKGQVNSTKLIEEPKNWQVPIAAAVAVWWLQNPARPLEAAATAVTQTSYN